ncbi:MAG: long-chain fatty acid--CoA ligase [Saprospiraceae bacterium]|nr:long-chain fatty acid--CoA ligase [Saprospiraceae bacterium]
MKALQTDWAAKWAIYNPHKTALKEYETGRTLSYASLNDWANILANYLSTHFSIKKGDRVAVLAEYNLEFVALFCAAQKAGFIIVPLNYRLSKTEVTYILTNSEPKIVLYEEKFETLLTSIPFVSFITFSALSNHITSANHHPVRSFKNMPLKDDDPIFILYTSGTTGFPKGALYSHKMLFWNSINTAMSLIINTESRTLNFMPPFHTGGWHVLLTPFLHHGGYTCLLRKFDPKAVLELLQSEKCTLFMAVPTMMKMLADLPEFDEAAFPDMHYAIVGGEPMPIPLIEKWANKNVAVRQGFGMTEVGPNLFSLHQDDALRKKGSIGRPNFYVQTKIVDENGKICDNGELLLRGPMVTKGYWRNEEATQKSIINGWFYSGDRVRCDDEGYFFVIDRIKNMYISGGENVYPAEVERVILTHPSVSEVAIVGVPDEKWGEVGKAFVVIKENVQVTENEIIIFIKTQLAKFKVPKYVQFLTTLPKNGVGKIDRQALKNID